MTQMITAVIRITITVITLYNIENRIHLFCQNNILRFSNAILQ